MTEPRSPFDPTPQRDDVDESTRAIRAINPDDARPVPPASSAASWDQPAPPPSFGHGYAAAPAAPPAWSAAPGAADSPTDDEKSKAFTGNLLATLLGWIGGLIGWSSAKDGNGWARRQCAKAFNFQLTMSILVVLTAIIGGILAGIGAAQSNEALFAVGLAVLYLGTLVIGLTALIIGLVQAFKARNGQEVRFPRSIGFLK